ncbi:MAG: 1-deoxy-D-xylulose-5-phosphate synthase N-terminal domain-containing protein, partial [Planctomycetota bacterium]
MTAPQTTAKHMRSDQLAAIARQIRRHSLSSTKAAGSGHPTSSMSCAELMAVLFFEHLRYHVGRPHSLLNDRFVLSKGHAAPALWGTLVEAGAYPPEELQHLREYGSELEGHPTPRSPFIDVPTGSLGQGLSVGLGMALISHRYGVHNHIWVLTGDSELSEGSNWEAAALAGHYGSGRLTVIVDANGLGQSGPTMEEQHPERYEQRFAAFGWRTRVIDGHDIPAIDEAYQWASEPSHQPTAIIAATVKGKGVGFLENADGRHGKPITGEEYDRAMAELGPYEPRPLLPVRPPEGKEPHAPEPVTGLLPDPDFGEQEATRGAYGAALLALTDRDKRVVVMDGEVSNSTKSEKAAKAHPDQYIEGYIAEQNMVG